MQALHLERHLLLDRHHPIREQPAQLERVALVLGEGEVLREQPVREERRAAQADVRRAAGGDGVVGRVEGAHRSRGYGRPAVHRRAILRTTMLIRVLLVVLLLAAVGAGVLVYRGSGTTRATDVGEHGITVECTAWTGADGDACAAWGAAVSADGAPSTTFDNADVVRIHFERGTFGFDETCTATWFVSRYPEDPAWTEQVPCGS